ncbi:hypothetical protein [Commensalibacter papalotli (ex Botero et al. 2024)]|uniref:Uncharacterized protein n=1 Tax=Commensalibacter papalotli (ex Botero et al. 2024) TaxID=2972766 RepID=A0ABM9HQF7_9PROT|nr:hypothetical protein [Commensalibacter papalotli (ex Botero et al. 2024)]CAI3931131.1 unnamed protein product [Commensalibacter papalotli (ex Botero et al. 2024)]CAI3944514.1 unnamed protein product [Commensalibacter papalotli (ex Botero et al. 2024)]
MKIVLQAGIVGLGLIMGGSAFAQDWAASCGHEPKAPTINVSNVTNYNSSVEHYTAYDKASRAYYACVAKAAHAKQTAISQKAAADMEPYKKTTTDVRNRITANLTKIQTELKAGGKKLGAKPKK